MVLIWINDGYHLWVLGLSRIHHSSILLVVLDSLRWTIHVRRILLLLSVVHKRLLRNLYLNLLHLAVLTGSTLVLARVNLWSLSFVPHFVHVVVLSLHVAFLKSLILLVVGPYHLIIRNR